MTTLSSTPVRSEALEQTRRRLHRLQEQLHSIALGGIWVPSGDAHLNEYLPEAWQRRQWLTGFTGSAGDALVSRTQAWLAVDSRYHEQVDQQVDPQMIQVLKLGSGEPRTLYDVVEELGQGFRLGVDPLTISVQGFRDLQGHCAKGGVDLVPTPVNWVDQTRAELEPDQPIRLGDQPVYAVSPQITGASVVEKLQQIRQEMAKQRIQVLPITKLDQIAWVLNLRGSDIPYNPVFIAYGLISLERAALFTHRERVQPEARADLEQAGVEIYDYEAYGEHLCAWADAAGIVGIAPQHTAQATVTRLGARATGDLKMHPIELLKARKNATELAHMRQANRRASRAKIRTLAWIDRQVAAGIPVSEVDVAERIQLHYQQEPQWCGLSFNTIAGLGTNSSIVHYGTPDPDQCFRPGQEGALLLLDSGSQFLGGTTDDTRTVILGQPTDLQRQRYTLVLQAHIHCASQRFPPETPGTQLDGITRSGLWQAGLNYGHGTGHGVGAFLNVHEGPIGISKRSHTPLEPGMIVSVEPGCYESGWGGIRIENLCEVQAVPDQEGWLRFEPLTWIPFDRRLIDQSLLTAAQNHWVQQYHQRVYEMFAQGLDLEDRSWLQHACDLKD